jgi:large subunit ribosomal protein L29
MKSGEFRNMTEEELQQSGRDLRRELFSLKFQLSTGQLEKTSRLGDIRRDIARVETILRERQLEQAAEKGAK